MGCSARTSRLPLTRPAHGGQRAAPRSPCWRQLRCEPRCGDGDGGARAGGAEGRPRHLRSAEGGARRRRAGSAMRSGLARTPRCGSGPGGSAAARRRGSTAARRGPAHGGRRWGGGGVLRRRECGAADGSASWARSGRCRTGGDTVARSAARMLVAGIGAAGTTRAQAGAAVELQMAPCGPRSEAGGDDCSCELVVGGRDQTDGSGLHCDDAARAAAAASYAALR